MLSKGTSLADSTETNVCLISLGGQSFPSPDRSVIARNERMTLYALSGVPTVDAKTRPRSCHSSPARSRSFAWIFRCCRNASTQSRGSASVRRDLPPGWTGGHERGHHRRERAPW